MRIWDKIFKKKEPSAAEPRPAAFQNGQASKEPYLTQTVVFGMHLYRSAAEDSSVYFVDEARGIRKLLVDAEGKILNFPGIVEQDFWKKEVSPNAARPQIRFRTAFERRRDRWIMLWQIQPDGQYWADDGFGMEHELEVTLYTYVDRNGDFTAPFQIYRIGRRAYTLDTYEYALERGCDRELEKLKHGQKDDCFDEALLFPRLLDTPAHENGQNRYALWDLDMARAYWNHPTLSKNLLEATDCFLNAERVSEPIGTARNIQASMTLFWLMTKEPAFKAALDKFFAGTLEPKTVSRLEQWGISVS